MDHPQNEERPHGVTPPSAAAIEDDQLPPRAWLVRNGVYLVLFGALMAFLYTKFGLDGMGNIAKAGLGLGLVIFIHELGHFLVAKWCDVHVQTFSIGFGPALPACSYKWGETTYKLALFPLGGYVKMVGEGDTDPDSENDPRSFKNKSVGQRMAIISAGVVMNVILAFVCFILVFSHGKEREPAVVGTIDVGGKAWEKGIPVGAKIVQIGSTKGTKHRPLYFEILRHKVALSSKGEKVTFGWVEPIAGAAETPDEAVQRREIEPRLEKGDLRPIVGVSPPMSPELPKGEVYRKERPYPVDYRSAAAAARPAVAFRPDDIIIATSDPDDPGTVRWLRGAPVSGPADTEAVFELSQLWERTAGQEITVWVFRHDGEQEVIAEMTLPPAHFEYGDTIIATTDPDDPAKVTPLPDDPRYPGEQGDIFVYQQRLERLAGQMMTYRVRRASGETADLLVPPAYHYTLGVRMQIGPVTAIREDSPGAKAGVQKGDILKEVELSTADGSKSKRFVLSPSKKGSKAEDGPDAPDLVDPVRLPFELRQWANAHEKEKVRARLTVLRDDPQTHEARQRKQLEAVDWEFRWRFDREVPIGRSSPLPIPELGIAYRVETRVDEVTRPPASAPGGLRKGDVIKAVRFREPGAKFGESDEGRWADIEPDQWAHVFYLIQLIEFKELSLRVERDGKTEDVTLTAQPVESWPLANRGLALQVMKVEQKAEGIFQAIEMGLQDTWRGLTEVYLFLRGIILQRLSVQNLGGPITIARVAYRFAHMDFYEFLFFLGMISINLAAFNFLPIPVLDGGHMVFLIYEKLRGKPASEQVQWSATLVGLVLLATLMIGVIILDVMKL